MLDTEAGTWGGVHKAHRKQNFHTTDGGVFGRDYTLTLDLPAMGSYLLRLSPEAPNPDAARLSANKALAQKRKAAKAAKRHPPQKFPISNIYAKMSCLL